MVTSIEVDFPGGKRIDARIGDTLIRTDQSIPHGGTGSAPEPFQLFLSSIATCAGIYAWEYCQKRELPTQGLGLRMDCDYDPQRRRYRKMTLTLTLPQGFPEAHRAPVVRAMNLCAVKKRIVDPPEFAVETSQALDPG